MKRTKTFRYSACLLAALALTATSCSKFGNDNVSPNAATTPVTGALLTSAETYLGADAIGSPTSSNGAPITGLYTPYFVQHQAQINYPDNQLYPTTGVSWDSYYVGPLEDLYKMIEVNTAKPDPIAVSGNTVNQIQIARILKAYYFSVVTDHYGDVPYSKALSGAVVVPYDKQQDIYTDLFKELTSAVGSFTTGGTPVLGDIIYNGDIAKWKKFANSLRLVLALRLSKVDPATGATQFKAALADPAGVITTNAEGFKIVYPGGTFNNPRNNYATATYIGITTFMANIMNGYNDPRVYSYSDNTNNGSNPVVGYPYGLTRAHSLTYQASHPNFANESFAYAPNFKKTTSSIEIFPAAYINLVRAEGALVYATGEDAYALTSAAITQSFAQWSVTGTPATYLAAAGILPGVTPLAKIQEQEWIALYGSEEEAWSTWRRTGVPALTPAPDAQNPSKQIPRRFAYPSTEPNINSAAFNAAVAAMPYGGKNDEVSRVWWDK